MKKYSKILACIIYSFSVAHSQDEGENWFKEEWLKSPNSKESRPSWWFDVWNGDGVIIVAELENPLEVPIDEAFKELLIVDGASKVSKFRMDAHKFSIEKVIWINPRLISEDINITMSKKIELFTTAKYSFVHGAWKRTIVFENKKKYIIFAREAGVFFPGMYSIGWKMPIENENDLVRIIKARNQVNSSKVSGEIESKLDGEKN